MYDEKVSLKTDNLKIKSESSKRGSIPISCHRDSLNQIENLEFVLSHFLSSF